MTSVLSSKHFHDETAAYEFLEARVWPKGPVCPHCGGVERISKMQGKSTPVGSYKCYQCRSKFTVKVGTVFEDSHVPMNLWLQAMYLCSSKKGISSNQLSRTLGVQLKPHGSCRTVSVRLCALSASSRCDVKPPKELRLASSFV